MKHTGGFRRKTRKKLRKSIREKGKISIRRYLQEFNIGDKVVLKAEPAVQKGMYFPAFHGKIGIVNSQRGRCYEIIILDGKKQKKLSVHPVHLKKA